MADITGAAGNDILAGTSGNDLIDGLAGNDTIEGGAGNDTILGGSGDDLLTDSAGAGSIDGGDGNDTIRIVRPLTYATPAPSLTISGGLGSDAIWLDSGDTAFVVDAGVGDDRITLGYANSLTLTLGAGSDRIDYLVFPYNITITDFAAGNGGDVLNLGDALSPWFDGHTNPFANGQLALQQQGDNVSVRFAYNSGGGLFDILILQNTTVTALTAHNFFGFDPGGAAIAAGVTVGGGALAETLEGGTGADTVNGGDGGDTIWGRYGNDALNGDAGDDSVNGQGGADTIHGGLGDDTILGGDQSDTLYGDDGNDTLRGEDLHYSTYADTLDGGAGDDSLIDGGGNDILIGGDGNDTITHLIQGSPTIDGGVGDDLITVDHGLTYYFENPYGGPYTYQIAAGSGEDRVVFSSQWNGNVTITLGDGNDRLRFASGFHSASASLGAGTDRVTLTQMFIAHLGLVIPDFTPGNAGDIIDLAASITDAGGIWDGVSNPFASGIAALAQVGADVVLRFNPDPISYPTDSYVVATFQNTALASFTAYNFGGLAPDGSAIVPVNLTGTAGDDTLTGTLANDTLNGLGGNDTLEGLNGDDTLSGGDGNDGIDAGRGNDTVTGGAGLDTIVGGLGDDTIHGGADADHITDTGGQIAIFGEGGDDTIVVAQGYGTVDGGDGNDDITANLFYYTVDHNDVVLGGEGNDTVRFSTGGNHDDIQNASIDLGSGDDTLHLIDTGDSRPLITLGTGTDHVVLDATWTARTSAFGLQNWIVLTDFATGNGGDSFDIGPFFLQRGQYLPPEGNPFAGGLYARLVQAGADTLLQWDETGSATDFRIIAVFQNTLATAFTDANFGFDLDAPKPPGVALTGGEGNDTLNGTPREDVLSGLGGDDSIFAGRDNDTLNGGDGNDTIYASFGDDTVFGGTGNDTLLPEQGFDTVDAGSGDDAILLFDAIDQIDGGAGLDTITYNLGPTSANAVNFDFSAYPTTQTYTQGGHTVSNVETVFGVSGTAGNDIIYYGVNWTAYNSLQGFGGDDQLTGGSGLDTFSGGTGNDVLTGLDGNDQLLGDDGDDILYGGNGDDGFVDGAGNDTIYGGDDNDNASADLGDDIVFLGAGNDTVYALSGSDQIDGGDGDDRISVGLANGDSVNGGSGIDRLVPFVASLNTSLDLDFTNLSAGMVLVDGVAVSIQGIEIVEFPQLATYANNRIIFSDAYSPQLTIYGGSFNDFIAGGSGNDGINGEVGDDQLFGNGGNDGLLGSAGNDSLNGGEGDDLLDGGDGDDILTGGAGADFYNGGIGNDLFLVAPGGAFDSGFSGSQGLDELRATGANLHLRWTGSGLIDIDLISDGGFGGMVIEGSDAGESWDHSYFQTSGAIVFDAGAGNDWVIGNGQANILRGGAGDDTVNGQGGNDLLSGGTGADIILGWDGDDIIEVGPGDGPDQQVLGGTGFDTVRATGVDTRIQWFASQFGEIELLSANGFTGFIVEGSASGDNFSMPALGLSTEGSVVFETGAGDDIFTGNAQANVVYGGAGNDSIDGAGGNDALSGGLGDDTIQAGAGDDTIRVLAGYDAIQGGGGNDRIEAEGDGVTLQWTRVNQGAGTSSLLVAEIDTISAAGHTGFSIAGTDQIDNFDFTAIAFESQIAVHALGGNDVMFGLAGADLFYGGDGDDQLSGFGGADILDGGAGNDVLVGGAGIDQLLGGLGNDYYYTDSQADLIYENAGQGRDTIIASTGFYLYANVEDLALADGAGGIFGVGNELDNLMLGNEAANLVLGSAGNDWVEGRLGNDALFGESGNDTLTGGDGIDYLAGGSGNDDLRGGFDPDALYGEDGDDVLWGGFGNFTDILVGGAGNDILDGTSDQANPDYDLLDGGSGNDIYWVDTGADLTFEAVDGGTDTVLANVTVPNAGVYLYANLENLTLQGTTAFGVGNELDNQLTGSASGNWLLGGAGNDRITGGGGNDVLFGEAGVDSFVFGAGSGADLIGDFGIAEDMIEFAGIFTSFAQVQANMVQVGADMAIDLGGGSLVVLLGTDLDDLTAANFLFG